MTPTDDRLLILTTMLLDRLRDFEARLQALEHSDQERGLSGKLIGKTLQTRLPDDSP